MNTRVDPESILERLYNEAQKTTSAEKTFFLREEDLFVLCCAFCPRIEQKYGDLSGTRVTVRGYGRTREYASIAYGILVDALVRFCTAPRHTAVRSVYSYFKRILFTTTADCLKTGNDDRLAMKVHTALSTENDTVRLYEKSSGSFFNNWWGGKKWPPDQSVNKYPTGSNFHREFQPMGIRDALTPDGKVFHTLSDGDIFRTYTLYLCELDYHKLLVFSLVNRIIGDELQTFRIVPGPRRENARDESTEKGNWIEQQTVSMELEDPLVLYHDICALLPDIRDRLILFLHAQGYSFAEIEKMMPDYTRRLREHGHRIKNCKTTVLHERFKQATDILSREGYVYETCRDVIVDSFHDEFEENTQ